jgi:hypothetical protein
LAAPILALPENVQLFALAQALASRAQDGALRAEVTREGSRDRLHVCCDATHHATQQQTVNDRLQLEADGADCVKELRLLRGEKPTPSSSQKAKVTMGSQQTKKVEVICSARVRTATA